MDIVKTIATNLTAWMAASSALNTSKKLSVKSKVGFGTVQRARNGSGNITVQNLAAIAHAFGRSAIDLITPAIDNYAPAAPAPQFMVAENVTRLPAPDSTSAALRELLSLAETIDDAGRWQLVGQAKMLAASHPRAKANPAN